MKLSSVLLGAGQVSQAQIDSQPSGVTLGESSGLADALRDLEELRLQLAQTARVLEATRRPRILK